MAENEDKFTVDEARFAAVRARVKSFSRSVAAGAPIKMPKRMGKTRFQKQYFYDPVACIHDIFDWREGEKPTFYQDEIVGNLIPRIRTAVRGPHGLGKTMIASCLVHWFALTRDGEDWKCPTTASAWRQMSKYFWPELHKWARRIRWDKVGREPYDPRFELLGLSLKLKTGEAFAMASNDHEKIEGAHADHMLMVFDEAKAIPFTTFDAAEGAFMGGVGTEAYALAISTPGEPVGRFYDIHRRKPGYEDWYARHVTLQEVIKAGRMKPEIAEQRKKQWGARSAVYQNRVLGEFCASDEDGIIPLSWIEKANERFEAWVNAGRPGILTSVGGDIARSEHGDKNVIAPVYAIPPMDELPDTILIVDTLRKFNEVDTMSTTGKIAALLRMSPAAVGIIDIIAYGSGVVDRLREQGFHIIGFQNNGRADRIENGKRVRIRDKTGEFEFADMKSAAWWRLRELLDPDNREGVGLPPDDELIGDLTAPHWRVNSSGKIEVEGKDDSWPDMNGIVRPTLKQRLERSPDSGESVVMALTPRIWFDAMDTVRRLGCVGVGSASGWGFKES
jgi:hypothetical protein